MMVATLFRHASQKRKLAAAGKLCRQIPVEDVRISLVTGMLQTADRMHRLTRTEIPAIKCSGLRRGKREGVAAEPCGGELAIESRGVTCPLRVKGFRLSRPAGLGRAAQPVRSEEHTSELQSREN